MIFRQLIGSTVIATTHPTPFRFYRVEHRLEIFGRSFRRAGIVECICKYGRLREVRGRSTKFEGIETLYGGLRGCEDSGSIGTRKLDRF